MVASLTLLTVQSHHKHSSNNHFHLITLWMVDERCDPEVGDFGYDF